MPRRSSAAPAPSRSCGRRPRSTPPRRRRCSSPGCSSGTRPGRGSRPGRPPQTRPAGPRPPSPRPLRPAAGPPPPCGLAPARLLPTSEAGTPPPSSPGRARRSQRGPAPVGRALGRCGRPASPSLDRRRGLRGQLRAQASLSPTACARSGARSPTGGWVPASAPEGAGRVLRACSGDPQPRQSRGAEWRVQGSLGCLQTDGQNRSESVCGGRTRWLQVTGPWSSFAATVLLQQPTVSVPCAGSQSHVLPAAF